MRFIHLLGERVGLWGLAILMIYVVDDLTFTKCSFILDTIEHIIIRDNLTEYKI